MISLPALLAPALLAPSLAPQDRAPVQLRQRLEAYVPTQAPAAGGPSPRVLFTRSSDDNAAALLVRSDANGDGVPEIVVGWDIFASGDNLEVLAGGSFGAGQELWALETVDGVSGGYFYDIEQLAEFPDTTGDGVAELLTGTAGGGRAATLYDGATGAVLQSFDTYLGADSGWVYDVEVLGDVNGNGSIDFALATGSTADSVFCVDGDSLGHHHDELWQFEAADALYCLAVIGDVDGDGVTDVAAGAGDNLNHVYALSGADGSLLWQRSVAGSAQGLAPYGDLSGDGVSELVVGAWSSANGVWLLDGATGGVHWSSGVAGTFVMAVEPFDDVDGDGFPEIAVASWADDAIVLRGVDGSELWRSPTGGDVWGIDTIADVNGDGISEVAFGSFDGFTYLADGATGDQLWTHDAGGHKVLRIQGAPDLDGDGQPEVVAGAQQLSSAVEPLLFVLAGDGGLADAGPELTYQGSTGLGDSLTLDVQYADPGDVVVFAFGEQPFLLALPGIGALALLPLNVVNALTSVVSPGGLVSVSGDLPSNPALLGLELYLQAFEVDAGPAGTGRTTNRVGLELE